MYLNGKCRCDECKKAHADDCTRRRREKRGVGFTATKMPVIDRIVATVKRGDRIKGEYLDTTFLTDEDVKFIKEVGFIR
jgi:hypothetical protein